jgi:iron-sulfur cluster assembly protein
MVDLTSDALTVIRQVTDHPRLAATSGVRIARRQSQSERPSSEDAPLLVGIVNEPAPGDIVIQCPGARLYLEPVAARRVGDGALDAVTADDGRVHFVLRAAA